MKNIQGIACTSTGASHIKTGKECQDYSFYINERKYAAIMVSDGHGGDKHFRSRTGSEMAGEICLRELAGYADAVAKCRDIDEIKRLLKDFEKHLVYCWREEVENELIIHPFEPEEMEAFSDRIREEIEQDPHIAFGATLIVAVAAGDYVSIVQLGDGDCRIVSGNNITNPIAADDSLRFGKTSSLCNSDAISYIRDTVLPLDSIDSCFLSTDGVSNSFCDTEHFDIFLKTISEGLHSGESISKEDLDGFLMKLTREGSGDDVSIAALSVMKYQ